MPTTIKEMTELSQIIVNEHMVRFTGEQKQAFYEMLKENMPNKTGENEPLGKNKNITIGNIENADVILTAHYDTPKKQSIFMTNLKPQYKGKVNSIIRNLSSLIVYSVILMTVILIVFLFLSDVNRILSIAVRIDAILLISIIGVAGSEAIFRLRKPNKNNYNDNTSGVITLIEHLQTTAESEIEFTYIFFDNEEKGLKGSKALKKAVKQINDKIIINFDCVGVGDEIHIILPNNKSIWDNIDLSEIRIDSKRIHIVKQAAVFTSSDHKSFSNAICITAYEKDKKGNMIMKNVHTEKDDYMDYANIKAVIKVLEMIIERI